MTNTVDEPKTFILNLIHIIPQRWDKWAKLQYFANNLI